MEHVTRNAQLETIESALRHLPYILLLLVGLLACNPFAPEFDDSATGSNSILGDSKTVDGIFQNIKYAYTFKDTTIYGQAINANYNFVFRDYERGTDVSWGRDEEMRITSELFRNVQRLDLVWNNVISMSADSANTSSIVSRNFNLTVTFNPSDILRVDGYATLSLTRFAPGDPWTIIRWRDESNF